MFGKCARPSFSNVIRYVQKLVNNNTVHLILHAMSCQTKMERSGGGLWAPGLGIESATV